MSKGWGEWVQLNTPYDSYTKFIHTEFKHKFWDKLLAPTKRKDRTVLEIEWSDNTKSIHAAYNHLGGVCDDCTIDSEKDACKIIRYRTITL